MALMMFRHSEAPRHTGGAEPDADYVTTVARQAAGYAARGENPQALRCYQQALLVDDGRTELWFSYANLQWRMGLKMDAMESFEFALRQDPRLFAARHCLAKLLFEMGRPVAAMTHFQQVILQNPDYVPAWRWLARVYESLEQPQDALECLKEALQRSPNDPELAGLALELARQIRATNGASASADQ